MFDNNNQYTCNPSSNSEEPNLKYPPMTTTDYGPYPFIIDISKATLYNDTFRTALWTGSYLQLTLMSIPVGDDVGIEVHTEDDQFLYIESGHGVVYMGYQKDCLYFQQPVFNNSAVFVPAGIWHNIINIGDQPLKLFSIYAPPHHPRSTVHQTKAIAEAAENHY